MMRDDGGNSERYFGETDRYPRKMEEGEGQSTQSFTQAIFDSQAIRLPFDVMSSFSEKVGYAVISLALSLILKFLNSSSEKIYLNFSMTHCTFPSYRECTQPLVASLSSSFPLSPEGQQICQMFFDVLMSFCRRFMHVAGHSLKLSIFIAHYLFLQFCFSLLRYPRSSKNTRIHSVSLYPSPHTLSFLSLPPHFISPLCLLSLLSPLSPLFRFGFNMRSGRSSRPAYFVIRIWNFFFIRKRLTRA